MYMVNFLILIITNDIIVTTIDFFNEKSRQPLITIASGLIPIN